MSHVFIALSGGVDSSVAASLLRQEGHDLSAVHLQLLGCPSHDAEDARRAAEQLGIPFHLLDLSGPFRETVLRSFVETYQQGGTPNPCVVCNRTIKFGALLDWVLDQGGDALATGHYARLEQDPTSGRFLLKRAVDRKKDQSYFLYTLNQKQLSHIRFPLGELEKPQVRVLAEESALVTASKRDSQDICFVSNGAYASFIDEFTGTPSPTGPFLDQEGKVLGQHKGFIRYTKGQHKGLGLSTETPLYVLDKDPETCAIQLGPDSALWESSCTVESLNWISIPALDAPREVSVKTRYSQREAQARIEPLPDGRVRVLFQEPQRAITPGQSAVFYDGDLVVGGGILC